MSNKIQIKRSVANTTVTGLSNGEMAFTLASNTLWIGSPDGSGTSIPLAGVRNPGTLTANQALVANSSSAIDKVIVANAVITTLTANGTVGSNGQVLVTNGTAIYWGTGTSGANTQVQFNDSGVANGVAGFTFDKTSNTMAIGNTITTNNIFSNTSNASSYNTGGGYGSTPTGGAIVNTTHIAVGNSTSNVILTFANITIGSMYANGSYINLPGSVVAYTANLTTAVNIGSPLTGSGGILANNTTLVVGNSTVNTTITAAGLYVNGTAVIANSSGVYTPAGTVNALSFSIGSYLIANTSKIVFTGANVDATSATLTVNNVIISANLNVNNNLVVNGSIVLGNNSSDNINAVASFNSNIVPSANVTYDIGTTDMRWREVYSGNVHVVNGYFSGSVDIGGNLIVHGNVTTTDVQTIIVSDPLIYLAGNNTVSDSLDIGFAGKYNDGSLRNTGLFRDHEDGVYKLFYNLTQDISGNNNIDTTDLTYRIGTLQAYLNSGALISNTSGVTLVANSTFFVNVTANSISLTSPLAATSGGTGQNTYTSGDILVANTGNTLSKLGLGSTGYVLQSNGTALIYDILDGGSF